MTISSTQSRKSYSGNGSTTGFSFPYKFLSESDLVVVIRNNTTGVETTKTLTTDYTVSGAGGASGGTVTMVVAPASGETITILRDPELTQTVDFVENDKMPAEVLEEALDRQVMVNQRQADQLSRTAQLPEGYAGAFDPTLPTIGLEAGATLIYNDALTGFEVGPTADQILSAQADATAAAASAAAALASQTAAATSATASATSATASATSATASQTSATASADSATAAAASALAAQTAETNAELAETNAETAQAAAEAALASTVTARNAAQTAETNAETAETNAAASAAAALASQTAAATSATNAATSATNAATSEAGAAAAATAAVNAIIPSQTGNSGKFLKTDGSSTSWATAGGAGGVNFLGLDTTWNATNVTDRDADTSVGNWVSFADAAASTPTDLTGGTSSLTLSRTTTAGEILNGAASFKLVKGAVNEQGEGVSCVFNVPPAYQGKNATISIPFKVLSGSLVSGDLKVFVYDVTNSTLITPFNNDVVGSSGTIKATFPTAASAATPANQQYRLGLYFASTSTTAVTLVFDDVEVGPVQVAHGPVISRGETYTPTLTGFGTTTVNKFIWRQSGEWLEIEGSFVAGTPTASTAALTLPNGYTWDTSYYTDRHVVGFAGRNASQATSWGVAVNFDASSNVLNFTTAGGAGVAGAAATGSSMVAAGDRVSFFARVKGANLSGSLPLTSASTFRISNYLASGSRVTTTPTALGQYRSYWRNGGGATFSESSAVALPAALPSVANGIRIYNGNSFASNDGTNEPTRYDIFVGKNKNIAWEFYSSAGRTGFVDCAPYSSLAASAVSDLGYYTSYDPTTGIASIARPLTNGSATGHVSGIDGTGNGGVNDPYFDIIVSEPAIPVQVGSVRSEVYAYTGNGLGTGVSIRRWVTIGRQTGTAITYTQSSAGDSFTINEDGIYTLSCTDGSSTTAIAMVFSVNATSTGTSLPTVAQGKVGYGASPTANIHGSYSTTLFIAAGSVVRLHTGTSGLLTDDSVSVRITQVSK
jgi:hypothetical protein